MIRITVKRLGKFIAYSPFRMKVDLLTAGFRRDPGVQRHRLAVDRDRVVFDDAEWIVIFKSWDAVRVISITSLA